jgi:hypothetical protein
MAEVRSVRHDPATGEVLEGPSVGTAKPARPAKPRGKGRRTPAQRRSMTDAERQEFEAREKWRTRNESRKGRMLALLEELVPGLPTEGEPRTANEALIEIDQRTGAGRVLLDLERERNGSRVMVHAKSWDGWQGGVPRRYAHVSVWYRRGTGVQLRTKGVACESAAEARAVALALSAWADEVEAQGGGT